MDVTGRDTALAVRTVTLNRPDRGIASLLLARAQQTVNTSPPKARQARN
jgi:hypothetical protein